MFICPSRGRPSGLSRLASLAATGFRWIVRLDDDDPALPEYLSLKLPASWSIMVAPRCSGSKMHNDIFAEHPNEPWYGLMSDDVVPNAPGWESALIAAAGSDCLAYGDDGINGEKMPTHFVLGGGLARKMGWLIHPRIDRLYGDAIWNYYGRRGEFLRYCPKIELTHYHFSNDLAPMDSTYAKLSAMADKAVFLGICGPVKVTPANINENIPVVCNVSGDVILENVRHACGLNLPWLCFAEDVKPGRVLVVGGGPSVSAFIPSIREAQERGDIVVAMNGTMKMLNQAGVTPDYLVLLDARRSSVDFVAQGKAAHYLIASQCHPSSFTILAGSDVTLWHPSYAGVQALVKERECALIGGGSSVGLQALSIMFCMGYRDIHAYGFDSSFADGAGHAYPQPENDADAPARYTVGAKDFMAAPWMARQAVEFQEMATQLADANCIVTVHGTGLLPEVARQMTQPPFTVLTVYQPSHVYTPKDVTRLRDGVAANLSLPHRFVCMTNHPVPGVECIPLSYRFEGWWAKTEIFRPDLPFGRVLYIDLSSSVVGSLNEMASQPGIVITKDWYRGTPSQSVLLYTVGDFTAVWDAFIVNCDYWMEKGNQMEAPDYGDQTMLNYVAHPPLEYWQDCLPGLLVSDKVHSVPPGARIVQFHGKPKPHELDRLEERATAKVG